MKLLLLFLISTSLHAQYDTREHVTSLASDPLVDTAILKNIDVLDITYYGAKRYYNRPATLDNVIEADYVDQKVADVATLLAQFPSSVSTVPERQVITPWITYDTSHFYFLDGGTVPVMNFTVPVAVPPYPTTVPWAINDLIQFRIIYTDPQLESAVDQAARDDGIVILEDASLGFYTSVLIKMKVRLSAPTTWMETIAGYPTFYGVNVTGYLDYPTNAVLNNFNLYPLRWDIPDYKTVDNQELINLLLNVVKNNIIRIEALEVFHP